MNEEVDKLILTLDSIFKSMKSLKEDTSIRLSRAEARIQDLNERLKALEKKENKDVHT